ncbi:hypothetical protein NLU13_5293 [Sarocladium strictum]|uniref:Protein-arginine deiminase C-terminal domain-containing protein n=1 Tax=Sarocladium strictum TaxID=5046 RepID=A0AA39GI77_SARSR|nr:hypothetical protein NLU13_5293 [Sarocladium strictum]
MRSSLKAAVLCLAASKASEALMVTILADTNRDGVVNDKDLNGRDRWTPDLGAFFMANIGDTEQRCSSQLTYPVRRPGDNDASYLAKEAEFARCNDASDDVQRNVKYLAPLRVLPVPERDLPKDATATIRVTDEKAASLTRIFVKSSSGDWSYVNGTREFTAEQLKTGLELGVDARDVRRPGPNGWNGHASIEFALYSNGEKKASDTVALRVAPILTHHHVQKVQKTFVTNEPSSPGWGNQGVSQGIFAESFSQIAAGAGIKEPTYRFSDTTEQWTQDFFEAGYTSIPGPDGPNVLRVLIRSAQAGRKGGQEVFRRLRSDSVGAVQHLGWGGSRDSLGNLETIPPHSHNGVSYPAGRAMMGDADFDSPLMLEFLDAQEVQAPVRLDTSWLDVGHVDEFLQFLPADNERGWVLMVNDPLAGLDIIKAAAQQDGSQPAVSRPFFPHDPQNCHYNETLADLLDFANLTEIQQSAEANIQRNLDILRREIGLRDEDIRRVPGLTTNLITGGFTCWTDVGDSVSDGVQRLQAFPGDGEDAERSCPMGSSPPRSVRNGMMSIKQAGMPRNRKNSLLSLSGDDDVEPICCRSDGTDEHPECHPDVQERSVDEGRESAALYPTGVNSVVLTDSTILAAKQWGPIINGVDVLEEAVRDAYAKVGFNVMFQDDWFTHHLLGGEVHCGSNVWREANVKWWRK